MTRLPPTLPLLTPYLACCEHFLPFAFFLLPSPFPALGQWWLERHNPTARFAFNRPHHRSAVANHESVGRKAVEFDHDRGTVARLPSLHQFLPSLRVCGRGWNVCVVLVVCERAKMGACECVKGKCEGVSV